MKDFNSFINEENKNSGSENNFSRADGSKNGQMGSGVDIASLLSALAGKYEGASEDEIISAIISEAQKGRKNGTLKDEDLLAFKATISPMLSESQRKKLKKVVKYLLKQ